MSLMSPLEFANHIDRQPGWITQLKDAGRLVMEGDKIDVEASLQRIEDTANPSFQVHADRHELDREEKRHISHSPINRSEISSLAYKRSITKGLIEEETLKKAQIERKKLEGELLLYKDIESTATDGATVVCNRIESMFYALAPQFAIEKDEQKILAVMLDYWESIRGELNIKLNKMADF